MVGQSNVLFLLVPINLIFRYSIAMNSVRDFEELLQGLYPSDYENCVGFLRRKEYLVSPVTLRTLGITRSIQYPGDIMVTLPGIISYYTGF